MAQSTPQADPAGADFLARSSYASMLPSPESLGAPPPAYLPEVTEPSQLIPLPDPQNVPFGHADLRATLSSAARYAITMKVPGSTWLSSLICSG